MGFADSEGPRLGKDFGTILCTLILWLFRLPPLRLEVLPCKIVANGSRIVFETHHPEIIHSKGENKVANPLNLQGACESQNSKPPDSYF